MPVAKSTDDPLCFESVRRFVEGMMGCKLDVIGDAGAAEQMLWRWCLSLDYLDRMMQKGWEDPLCWEHLSDRQLREEVGMGHKGQHFDRFKLEYGQGLGRITSKKAAITWIAEGLCELQPAIRSAIFELDASRKSLHKIATEVATKEAWIATFSSHYAEQLFRQAASESKQPDHVCRSSTWLISSCDGTAAAAVR